MFAVSMEWTSWDWWYWNFQMKWENTTRARNIYKSWRSKELNLNKFQFLKIFNLIAFQIFQFCLKVLLIFFPKKLLSTETQKLSRTMLFVFRKLMKLCSKVRTRNKKDELLPMWDYLISIQLTFCKFLCNKSIFTSNMLCHNFSCSVKQWHSCFHLDTHTHTQRL